MLAKGGPMALLMRADLSSEAGAARFFTHYSTPRRDDGSHPGPSLEQLRLAQAIGRGLEQAIMSGDGANAWRLVRRAHDALFPKQDALLEVVNIFDELMSQRGRDEIFFERGGLAVDSPGQGLEWRASTLRERLIGLDPRFFEVCVCRLVEVVKRLDLSAIGMAVQYIYPDEDAALLACTETDQQGTPRVDLGRRVLYGFLDRAGWRREEALGGKVEEVEGTVEDDEQALGDVPALTWRRVDVEHGVVHLDREKTGRPRPVPLDPDLVRALGAWRTVTPRPKDDDLVFVDMTGTRIDRYDAASLAPARPARGQGGPSGAPRRELAHAPPSTPARSARLDGDGRPRQRTQRRMDPQTHGAHELGARALPQGGRHTSRAHPGRLGPARPRHP
jgi:hypothetical protein